MAQVVAVRRDRASRRYPQLNADVLDLIADALIVRGHSVLHIRAVDQLRTHRLNLVARVRADGAVDDIAVGLQLG